MKKKVISLMMSAAMVATVLAGCGAQAAAPAPAAEVKEEAPAAE